MNTKYLRQLLFRSLSVSAVLVLAFSPLGGAFAQDSATYVVNTTNDVDDGVCNNPHCSLREAINLANAHPGADAIAFNIRGRPPFTIQPMSALPEITDPVTIDGTTQRGYAGQPIVELDGSNAGEVVGGLVISAGDSTVKGLVVNRFSSDGMVLTTNGGNRIQGNFIGTDVTGTIAMSNALRGILVTGGSSGNLIGGTGAHAGNLISGNVRAGVRLEYSEGNQLQGNFIGMDINGTSPLANDVGIKIDGAANNVIGGTEAGARNLISGNSYYGMVLGSDGNIVQGNYIGTDVTGSITTIPAGPPVGDYTVTALPETCPTYDEGTDFETDLEHFISESNDPVAPWSGTSVHFLGSDGCPNEMLGEASLIYRYKLEFAEPTQLTSIAVSGANFNQPNNVLRVLDEYMNVLGTTTTFGEYLFQTQYIDLKGIEGTIFYIDEFDTSTTWRYRQSITINEAVPQGNLADGVFIAGPASDNLIVGNLISGNMWFGVEILGATGNTLLGNLIGTDASGTTALPNAFSGVTIGLEASDNLIGGVDEGAGNLISGNGEDGVNIADPGTTGNIVQGNLIGTDASGIAALPNSADGVRIRDGASYTLIGGAEEGAGNLLSGNGGDGVSINESGTTDTVVQGNLIGTDASGTAALPNGGDGVRIRGEASNTLIGGTEDGARNVISGNTYIGISIWDPGTSDNIIQGNFIGTDDSGAAALPNGYEGVSIFTGASRTLIGGTEEGTRNVISGNGSVGVLIADPGTSDNIVQGNYIGTDASGTVALQNGAEGVRISSGASNTFIGGTEEGARNVISGNGGFGIAIADPGTSMNKVQGNFIGTDFAGTIPLGNVFGIGVSGGAAGNEIGGTEDGAGNVISGNIWWGVLIYGDGVTGNLVQGNFIGTDASGTMDLGHLSSGVFIGGGAADNLIGGTEPGAGNTIAFNGVADTWAGIALGPNAGPRNALLSNSIYSNRGLGIDLDNDTLVTPNDPLDGDTGPNDKQNFPVITTVKRVGRAVMIYGTFESTPSTIFRLEFFSNDTCDPSGNGEGQAFLGSAHVKTDQAGFWNFIITLPVTLPQGAYVTATATGPAGSTSEFSACFGP